MRPDEWEGGPIVMLPPALYDDVAATGQDMRPFRKLEPMPLRAKRGLKMLEGKAE